MPTSVKMDERTKSKLEELQAEIKLATGRKITQQEVLKRLVETTYESREELVESFREPSLPLSDDEIERFHAGTSEWGFETTEEEIDEILYGAQP